MEEAVLSALLWSIRFSLAEVAWRLAFAGWELWHIYGIFWEPRNNKEAWGKEWKPKESKIQQQYHSLVI